MEQYFFKGRFLGFLGHSFGDKKRNFKMNRGGLGGFSLFPLTGERLLKLLGTRHMIRVAIEMLYKSLPFE